VCNPRRRPRNNALDAQKPRLKQLGIDLRDGFVHRRNGRDPILVRKDTTISPLDLRQDELRSAHTPWASQPSHRCRRIEGGFRCDILVIGSGITGALIAERLTRDGRDVVIVDRERPGQGSTLASTAMLLWDIDRSLSQLTELYGFERAARAYQASLIAARGLSTLISHYRLPCSFRPRKALYLAAGDTADPLLAETALRSRAGLPAAFLGHAALRERFGINRPGAILSADAADSDPISLANGLLDVAHGRGARLLKGEATTFDARAAKVTVGFENGSEAEANIVVLATGYVMPSIVRATIQQPSSSWAIATAPQPQNLWPEGTLIWEATENYHYGRTTMDGRIIFGGEDEQGLIDPEARDAATASKARQLEEKLKALWPRAQAPLAYRWSGTFDTTRNGLPLIGAVADTPNLFAAYGYGGNGITFSYLAATLIAKRIAGDSSPLFDDFAIERDAP
jgi:glycine/D-amino acid oxidase-like deaminating enzyme